MDWVGCSGEVFLYAPYVDTHSKQPWQCCSHILFQSRWQTRNETWLLYIILTKVFSNPSVLMTVQQAATLLIFLLKCQQLFLAIAGNYHAITIWTSLHLCVGWVETHHIKINLELKLNRANKSEVKYFYTLEENFNP